MKYKFCSYSYYLNPVKLCFLNYLANVEFSRTKSIERKKNIQNRNITTVFFDNIRD
jgi:hypothetical protein